MGFPCGSAGKESTCHVGDLGSIPGLGRSPGEGKGYSLHYPGLENSWRSPWAIQPSHPLLPVFPPVLNLSQHQGLSNESAIHIRWPKYWSFSFSLSPASEYSGLIFFRMDWFDLLAVQGTLKSFLQQHSSTASVLSCSAFFVVQFHIHT